MGSWLVVLTLGLPWLGALLVWLLGDRRERAQHVTAAAAAVAAGLTALLLPAFSSSDPVIAVPLGEVFGTFTLVADGLGVFLAVIATVIGSLAVIFSAAYMKGEAQLGRYYALVLLFIGAMVGLAFSGSLLFLFFFWEMTAFCSYALISFHNDDPRAVAGGIKALVVTGLGGVGLLVGALLVNAYLGTYQVAALLAGADVLPENILAFVAFAFLLAAMAKSAQVPLHIWLPDAMEAPSPVSALIHAATMVNAGVYLLARFFPAFAGVAGWQTIVLAVGMVSALLAALMACVSNDLKRVLAYSTISQLGYMVYAVGVGAVFASQFHLLSHAIFKALLFLAAGAIIHALGTRDMRQMGGLWRGGLNAPRRVTGIAFLCGAAALAGLPIFNGFWSKELVLDVGLIEGPWWGYLGMLLAAGVTAFYTARMVWMTLWGDGRPVLRMHETAPAMRGPLAILAAGTLLSWLLAGPLSHWMAATLPFHTWHAATTTELVLELLLAPSTYVALVVVGAGLAAWLWRRSLGATAQRPAGPARPAWSAGPAWSAWPAGLADAAGAGFGFDRLGSGVSALVQRAGAALQLTQSGLLNWNVAGIILGLILILLVIVGTL